MAIDVVQALQAGGRPAIKLLEYSVMSVQLEIMFLHLVADYRFHPSAHRALALFDVFCVPNAPARIEADTGMPPENTRLSQEIRRIRDSVEAADAHNAQHPDEPIRYAAPARHIFDETVRAITAPDHPRMRRIAATYDPSLDPAENLPGGRMTAGQRAFVERVWRARLRPQLVRAGFPRIAAIGA